MPNKMELLKFVASFLSVTAVTQAGQDLETRSSPAFLIVGTENGKIMRCHINNPENCETFHEGIDPIWATEVHGEYLFAAVESEKILRCEWNRKLSCAVYHEAEDYIVTLTVSDGYLYAGGSFGEGVVLLCELNRPNSCFLVQKFSDPVVNMYELNDHMYIATVTSLFCCSKGENLRCLNVRVEENLRYLVSVTHLGSTIITITFSDDDVRYYNLISSKFMKYIQKADIHFPFGNQQIKIFKRYIYVLKFSGDIQISTERFNNFKEFVRHKGAHSISFAYATHRMHHNENGVSKCMEQSSSPALFNYNVEHRSILEVTVVDGLLMDARGAVVDTRRADRGYSGPAAVFAMGPDGQLLLSYAHESGLVHISSLFAGNPVSGAGEIIVEDGVVKRIIACSVAYWPDIDLNRQVVDELYRKGYERADEIKLETCKYT